MIGVVFGVEFYLLNMETLMHSCLVQGRHLVGGRVFGWRVLKLVGWGRIGLILEGNDVLAKEKRHASGRIHG